MNTFLIILGLWIILPQIGILISGRKLSFKGWLLLLVIWPVAWLFMDEELP